MDRCELVEQCIFFNDKMSDYPFAAAQMKERYCLGDNLNCARHIVLEELGRDHVPSDLFPNDVARAERIVAGTDPRPLSV